MTIQETVNFLDSNLTQKAPGGYLVALRGGDPITIEGIVTLGRDPLCDIRLYDTYVSTKHCQFEKRPTGYFVRDLKSRNGVRINGLRVNEGQLINGAEIQIGETYFTFHSEMPAAKDDLPLKSRNPHWQKSLSVLPVVAKSRLPVFLQGASGTGKEVIAHILHDYSERCEGPMVSVNCSALSETLVESELFGHVKGSFTGATGDRKGAFEAARGGTLFLDEIGDLPLSLQPKLLRALENHEIKPVGSDKPISTDVRIVTATHKNLEKLVGDGAFRSDLYFRIHVIKIAIPSLADRPEDFEDLLYHFCREMRVRFSVAAIEGLKRHTWPGNIRELRNTVARASALFPQTQISVDHLPQLVNQSLITPSETGERHKLASLKEVEKEMIIARLAAHRGNQRKTALDLGMPKSTLHDRIKSYNIDLDSFTDIE